MNKNIMKTIFKKTDGLFSSFDKIEKCKELFQFRSKRLKKIAFSAAGVDCLLILIGAFLYTKILFIAFAGFFLLIGGVCFFEEKLMKLRNKEVEGIKHDFYKLLLENNHLLSEISSLSIDEYSEKKFLEIVDCIMKKEDDDVWDKFNMLVSNYEDHNGNKEHLVQRQEFLKNLSIDIASHEVKDNDSYQKSAKQKLLEML